MSEPITQNLRPMHLDDLERILAWRNHPEIRRCMYSQHEISFDEHSEWFLQASQDKSRHLLIYEMGTIPLGFINIHQIATGGIAAWGFYTAPDAPKGTGKALGKAALRFAFGEAMLFKLCGQVLIRNEKSIRFHQKLGFKQEGVLRRQHFDGQVHHDIVCFGMLSNEWGQINSIEKL